MGGEDGLQGVKVEVGRPEMAMEPGPGSHSRRRERQNARGTSAVELMGRGLR